MPIIRSATYPSVRAYPLLVSAYPVLHLAATNAGEWIRGAELLVPLAISASIAIIAWLVATRLTKDSDKQAFLASLGVLAFAGYGAVHSLTMQLSVDRWLAASVTTVFILLVGLAYATLWVLWSRRDFALVTRFLCLMSALLVLFASAQFVRGRPHRQSTVRNPSLHTPTPASSRARPTIYLIVPDKYTGTASLQSYYGYDNTAIEQALRARGFVIPQQPRANYTYTRQAMTSLLNWEYLDSLASAMGEKATDWTPIFARAVNNRTVAFLKGLGYEFVFFPNYYVPFRSSRHADFYVPDPEAIGNEFLLVWQRTTLLAPATTLVCMVRQCTRTPWDPESTSLIDWKFAQLGPLAATDRPRFIQAHLLTPHEPYVYRADCSHVPGWKIWPDTSARRTAYLAQISCVNRKLLEAVDAILRTSPTPPVILIQSDHGDGHFPKAQTELADATPAMVRARLSVFAAYYVPGAPDTLFYDGMTPVNLLPRVFNFVFGTTFPRLPDRGIWVVEDQPYRMTALPGYHSE